MQQDVIHRRDRGGAAAILGGIAIVVGVAAYLLDLAAIDLADWLGGSGWTLFIIVPGLALLAVALVLEEGPAFGATIAGAIITTVGGLLLYQDQTAHYESWAYAWALIPGAVGAANVVQGLRFNRSDLVSTGTRIVAVFGVVLVVGWWYFETIFRTNEAPFNLAENWPIALILLGAALFVGGLLRGSSGGGADQAA